MVRHHLIPSTMSLRLLGPRLLVIKFRGAQKNLTVIVAHAPCSDATHDARTEFYLALREATSCSSESSTRVVLIDANAGPGNSRTGWEHIVGPHGIPYPLDVNKDPNCVAFGSYCYDFNLCVGHTWFQHKVSHKRTFYPNTTHTGLPRDMDHVLIDGRSSTNLENVKTAPGAIISRSGTIVNGELAGHRCVVATLHCRLQSRDSNIPARSYVRSDCLKKDVQAKIQETLKQENTAYQLGNNALIQAGHFGLTPDSPTGILPDPDEEVLPHVLNKAVDNLVDAGHYALLSAASQHAPCTKQEKRFKKPYTTEQTRQLSLLRGLALHTRQRVRTLGQNTLARAAFETFRAWRSLRLHNRGATKGSRGVPFRGGHPTKAARWRKARAVSMAY